MTLRSKHLAAVSLLILLTKIFHGSTQTCRSNEYAADDNECCPRCPPGKRVKSDCTEFKSTTCLVCVDGTFMNVPSGLKHCLPCRNCGQDSGLQINSSCTTEEDAVCEAQKGFYCIDLSENHCAAAKKHSRCNPGQYIQAAGTALADTVCSDCSQGTFSDGTLSHCQPHTLCESLKLPLKQSGTSSTDAECGGGGSTVIICVCVGVGLIIVLISTIFMWKKKMLCFSMIKMGDWMRAHSGEEAL